MSAPKLDSHSSSCWWSLPSSASSWRCCCRQFRPPAKQQGAAQCTNKLRQLVLASQNYASAKNGALPPGSPDHGLHGGFTFLLPYLEESNLYDTLDLTKSAYDSVNQTTRYAVVDTFICPNYPQRPVIEGSTSASQNGALTTYQGNGGAVFKRQEDKINSNYGDLPLNGAFRWGSPARRIKDITDGTTNTLLFGEFVHTDRDPRSPYFELPGNIRPWFAGAPNLTGDDKVSYMFKAAAYTPNTKIDRVLDAVPYNHLPFSSFHPGVTNFAYADGSVHLIVDDVNLDAYKFSFTIKGDEVVSDGEL